MNWKNGYLYTDAAIITAEIIYMIIMIIKLKQMVVKMNIEMQKLSQACQLSQVFLCKAILA